MVRLARKAIKGGVLGGKWGVVATIGGEELFLWNGLVHLVESGLDGLAGS